MTLLCNGFFGGRGYIKSISFGYLYKSNHQCLKISVYISYFIIELSQTPTRKSNIRKHQRNKNIPTVLMLHEKVWKHGFYEHILSHNVCFNLCLIEHEQYCNDDKVCFVNCKPPEVTKKAFIAYVCIGCEKVSKIKNSIISTIKTKPN